MPASERLYFHRAVVAYRGAFPLDMLRRDAAFPVRELGARTIMSGLEDGGVSEEYERVDAHGVHIKSRRLALCFVEIETRSKSKYWEDAFTVERWQSFGIEGIGETLEEAILAAHRSEVDRIARTQSRRTDDGFSRPLRHAPTLEEFRESHGVPNVPS